MQNTFLTPHFSLLEMCESRTAKRYGIVNVVPPETVENLKRLCEATLEPLREALGLPVVITCGYRCQRLTFTSGKGRLRAPGFRWPVIVSG